MILLGIDPGTKRSGFCLYRGQSNCESFTIKADNWQDMANKVIEQIKEINPDIVAAESFQHEGWRKGKINTSAVMGKLTERIASYCHFNNIRHVEYCARDTKANKAMDFAHGKNGHERSAYCVAVYAEGVLRMGGVR